MDGLVTIYKYLPGDEKFDKRMLFSLADKDMTRPSVWKLYLDKYGLEIRHIIFKGEGS